VLLGIAIEVVMASEKNDTPPNGLPTYRLLTGPDDAAFCHRVSEALALGYKLYGPPAATFNGETVIVAQAIIWPSVEAAIARQR
jgi:hypothetical protein